MIFSCKILANLYLRSQQAFSVFYSVCYVQLMIFWSLILQVIVLDEIKALVSALSQPFQGGFSLELHLFIGKILNECEMSYLLGCLIIKLF